MNLVTYLRVTTEKNLKSKSEKEYKKYVLYIHMNFKSSKWDTKRRAMLIKYNSAHGPDGVATQNG